MSEPCLKLEGLSVRVGDAALLDAVDLELGPGGRLALVGRSGAGKTTLLSAVAGLCPLSAGAIAVAGRPCAAQGQQRLAPAQRGVGLVFQELALWEHLTVAETLAFAAPGRRPERRARAAELAGQVGLGARLGAFPGELSGGERQRLALARALAQDPRLLLLDEPFAHLDPPLRRELSALVLERVAAGGLGLVVASHALEDVERLCDRLCVLEGGRVVEQGDARARLAAPESAALARLFELGNVLEGEVRGGRLVCPLGALPCPGPDGPAAGWVPAEGIVAEAGGVAATVVGEVTSQGQRVRELRTADGLRLVSALEAAPGQAVEVGCAGELRRLD
ncbi:MAG: ATP-binding cassette domain-containing protein [Planctomycetota bacterium]